jgi:hypothetical protein
MMPGHEWYASEDPADLTGKAIFRMCGQEVTIRMAKFSDFHGMCELLNIVYNSGGREGARLVMHAAQDAYKVVGLSM